VTSYGLYFDGIDDIDDEEYVDDFDAFSPISRFLPQ